MKDCRIVPVRTSSQCDLVQVLFQEYARWLGIDLGFQGFAEELAGLPGKYAPPKGELLLALRGKEPLGCAALRPFKEETGEVKRLWVRQEARGRGLGKKLAARIISIARERGYRRLVLDTLSSMAPAIGLYTSLGFQDTPPYYRNPHPQARYFDLSL